LEETRQRQKENEYLKRQTRDLQHSMFGRSDVIDNSNLQVLAAINNALQIASHDPQRIRSIDGLVTLRPFFSESLHKY
jgi:hypothetical protein